MTEVPNTFRKVIANIDLETKVQCWPVREIVVGLNFVSQSVFPDGTRYHWRPYVRLVLAEDFIERIAVTTLGGHAAQRSIRKIERIHAGFHDDDNEMQRPVSTAYIEIFSKKTNGLDDTFTSTLEEVLDYCIRAKWPVHPDTPAPYTLLLNDLLRQAGVTIDPAPQPPHPAAADIPQGRSGPDAAPERVRGRSHFTGDIGMGFRF